ncbi:MAG: P-loop NTPase, partial [Pseudomonadota bacterium]
MAKIIVVTSGKGGVGKTTSTAALGAGLAMKGHKTVVIDFDVGLRNLDVISACFSFASSWMTLMRSKTTRRSQPMMTSRLRRPTSRPTR